MNEEEKRAQELANVVMQNMSDEEKRAFSLMQEIKRMIKSIADEGTPIDSGCGGGGSDLWFTVEGVEYIMTVRQSGSGKTIKGDHPLAGL